MSARGVVKVDKVRSSWFLNHFDTPQASVCAVCARMVKVVKVIFSRT